jgi:DNA-binding transcriptional MocR family regulator
MAGMRRIARRALRHNIVLAPGNAFSPAQSWPDYLRFNAAQSSTSGCSSS